MENDRQRLDKWIWFARVVKSRTLAARLVEAGHVRVNGQRAATGAKAVVVGDVLTLALEREVRVLEIVGLGERRGPFKEACLLFRDLSEQKPSCA
jgi:ribosome-associated heat shock protein Hsp15